MSDPAEPGTAASDLALKAARRVLARARRKADKIDLALVATSTPDYKPFSSVACVVQERLPRALRFGRSAGERPDH